MKQVLLFTSGIIVGLILCLIFVSNNSANQHPVTKNINTQTPTSTNAPTATEPIIESTPELTQKELELQWHQPMAETLGLEDNDTLLEALYYERAVLALEEETIYYASQMDYETCHQKANFDLDLQSLDTFSQSIEQQRNAFINAYFGDLPSPLENVELTFRELILESDDYTLEYIVFPSRLEHINVYAYLLVPKLPPNSANGYPVVILNHANNDNIEAMVGISSKGRDRSSNAALEYVKQGSIVVVPYLIDNVSLRTNALIMGHVRDGKQYLHLIQRIISVVDWLNLQSEYPISRVAVHGLSYGGTLALWSGMLDDRIDTVAISNSIRDYSYWLYGNQDEQFLNINPFLFFMDYCQWDIDKQLLFLIPSHVYIESSTLDKNLSGRYFGRDEFSDEPLDMTNITTITDGIQEIYDQLGIGDQFEAVTFEGYHVINAEEAVPWVMQQLTRP